MTRLEYTDGTSITLEEAAALIEAEGVLIQGWYCNPNGRRCLVGVLDGWGKTHPYTRQKTQQTMAWLASHNLSSRDNDRFKGTIISVFSDEAAFVRFGEGSYKTISEPQPVTHFQIACQ